MLIRGARQLLTLNGPTGPRRGNALSSVGLIENGAVLIIDGVVSAVGPARRVENLAEARGATEINATGRVVMPSLIDPHAHLLAGESLIDREDREELLVAKRDFESPRKSHIGGAKIRKTPAKTIEHRGRKLLEMCARHGTGTVDARSGHGLEEAAETKLLRVLAEYSNSIPTVIPAFVIPAHAHSFDYEHRDEYLSWITGDLLGKIAHRKLTRFVAVESDSLEPSDPATLKTLFEAIAVANLPAKLDTDGADPRVIDVAIRQHVVSIDGLRAAREESAKAIANSAAIGVVTPADGLSDEYPHGSARTLIDCGVPLALGTGLHHSRGGTYNMQSVIATACSRLKMTTSEAICAATVNAAYALGFASRIGSLQFGKDADIIVLAISDYREMSYYAGVNQVELAIKHGAVVYPDSHTLL
jgi:imidazolonepropionase